MHNKAFTFVFVLKVDLVGVAGDEGHLVSTPRIARADHSLDDGQVERDVCEAQLERTIGRLDVLVRYAGDKHSRLIQAFGDLAEQSRATAAATFTTATTGVTGSAICIVCVQPHSNAVSSEELAQTARIQPAKARLGRLGALGNSRVRIRPRVADEHNRRLVAICRCASGIIIDAVVGAFVTRRAIIGQLSVKRVDQVAKLVSVSARILHDDAVVAANGSEQRIGQPLVRVDRAELAQYVTLLQYIFD